MKKDEDLTKSTKSLEPIDISTSDLEKLRDKHYICQLAILEQEDELKDNYITGITASFCKRILDSLEEFDIIVDNNTLASLNQFIYLINSNYYDRLSQIFPNLNRTEIIEKIINQISFSMMRNNLTTFDESNALTVLQSCFLIPNGLKDEIAREFKKSKVIENGFIYYKIIRKDIPPVLEEYQRLFDRVEKEHRGIFNPNYTADYWALISVIASQKQFIENGIGDPKKLSWDVSTLKDVLNIIIKKCHEAHIYNEKYSNNLLAQHLAADAAIYALVNSKTVVDQEVILNTFKNCKYLPFYLKLDVIDEIMLNNNIDYSKHPLKLKRPRTKALRKIIEFKK